MKRRQLAAILAILSAACTVGAAQDPSRHGMAMHHGGTKLFLAQAAANKVHPAGTSSATATGAFLVDPAQPTVSYDLTYHGLENGPPKSIALHNFGEGGNGARIHTICAGDAGRPCPNLASANLTGSWAENTQASAPIDTKLLGEFASARVYLEVVGGDGRPEIRGQLEPNGAMVPFRNFVAHLSSAQGGSGVGTAVLSEAHFADGRVSVFYQVTVAGTSSAPQGVALVGVAAAAPAPPKFSPKNALPQFKSLPSRAPATGGTLFGQYEVRRDKGDALFATKLFSAGNPEVGISVRTSRFPDGELYGIFKPVG